MSFRFHESTVERLRAHARQAGAKQTELVERYVDEGLRQEDHPLIYFRPAASGRRAALLGTRLYVSDLVTTVRQNENSVEEAAEYLDIPVAYAQAAIRYYVEFQDELDAEIQRSRAAAERERQLAEREQRALG